MEWNFDNERPIYSQIIEQIKAQIISGNLEPGSRLASVRELATEAGVNPNTMQRALSQLEDSGLIISNRTLGREITVDVNLINAERESLAIRKINDLFDDMEKIGYSKAECLEYIKNIKED